jgi:hypothetical protein
MPVELGRRRPATWLLALSVAIGALHFCRYARADHTEAEHITDDTAFTLSGDKNWRVGLYKAAVALHDRVTLSTYIWPWVLRTPNLALKWQFYSGTEWHWATQLGVLRLDTAAFDRDNPNAPVFSVGTFDLMTSYRIKRKHQISADLTVTAVRLSGELTADTFNGAGEAAVTNSQWAAAYEYRWSERLALIATGRFLLGQVLSGQLDTTIAPDPFTTIELRAEAADRTVINYENAFSIVASAAWSWQTFNLRLGLGYGNFNVPGINFMVERKMFFPELDLYWTF